jgi:hypothetical protein
VVQLGRPLLQAAHIVEQPAHLGLDDAGLIAHPRIAHDRLHHLDRHHQQRGRDDQHPRLVRALHHILEMLAEIGIKRLGRHEQQRQILRFPGNQVFVGNILDMQPTSARTRFSAAPAASSLVGLLAAGEGFERELGIHHQRAVVAGQVDDAIGPRAVGQRRLEG